MVVGGGGGGGGVGGRLEQKSGRLLQVHLFGVSQAENALVALALLHTVSAMQARERQHAARVPTTERVCGWQPSSIKRVVAFRPLCRAIAMETASATAVPSSSSEAFAISNPVRSVTMVWKFTSASSLP